jgi:hypothetical protein
MLDPAKPRPLDLGSLDSYLASCLALAQERLPEARAVEEALRAEAELNCYPRLESLEDPRDVFVADEQSLEAADIAAAAEALLSGRVLLEHACAGEATRLGLGAKYLINPRRDLVGPPWENLLAEGLDFPVQPAEVQPLSLGRRHMLQLAWDLSRLAEQMGRDPAQALARQRLLIIVNEQSAEDVLADFRQAGFYGFDPAGIMFMVQRSFLGLTPGEHGWRIDPASPRRLHNHGQMLMQTAMDGQLFRLDPLGRRSSLAWRDYADLLAGMADKVSFNIEDLDYLGQSLDLTGLAAALKLGGQGARMVMEVVTNNPRNPIKGGACYFDPGLARNVMIESFQLKGIAPADIHFLNKNVNHYPQPLAALTALRERGLSMPIAVKGGHLYFQPVQGDLNFLLPTAFLRRKELKPIHAWKAAVHTPTALAAMAAQDARPGFLPWAASLLGLAI